MTIMTSAFSKSSVFITLKRLHLKRLANVLKSFHSKHCLRKKAFLVKNLSGFDRRPNWKNKGAFSNLFGILWTKLFGKIPEKFKQDSAKMTEK